MKLCVNEITVMEGIEGFLECLYEDTTMLRGILLNVPVTNLKELLIYACIGFCLLPVLLLFSPLLFILGTILFLIFVARNVSAEPAKPKLYGDEEFKKGLLSSCPSLRKR